MWRIEGLRESPRHSPVRIFTTQAATDRCIDRSAACSAAQTVEVTYNRAGTVRLQARSTTVRRTDDGSTDDGSTDDGSTDDGSTDDGLDG